MTSALRATCVGQEAEDGENAERRPRPLSPLPWKGKAAGCTAEDWLLESSPRVLVQTTPAPLTLGVSVIRSFWKRAAPEASPGGVKLWHT